MACFDALVLSAAFYVVIAALTLAMGLETPVTTQPPTVTPAKPGNGYIQGVGIPPQGEQLIIFQDGTRVYTVGQKTGQIRYVDAKHQP